MCIGYALESKLKRAYSARLHAATQEQVEAYAVQVYGPLLSRATTARPAEPLSGTKARALLDARVDLLDEVVPELLAMLPAETQAELAPLLLEQHDVAAFARAIVQLNGAGNKLYPRKQEAEEIDDLYLFKAAGMGRLSTAEARPGWVASQKARGLPTGGPPLVLTSWVPRPARKPSLRAKKRRPRRVLVLRGQYSLFSAVAGMEAGL